MATSGAEPGVPAEEMAAADLRSVVPATLAGVAESGILFLFARLFAEESVGSIGGPMTSYPVFALLFTAAVAVGAVFRRSRYLTFAMAGAAVVFGFLQATRWGTGEPAGTLFTMIAALLVGLRALTLALRDWRNPATGSFGWGTGVLLLEVMIGTFGEFDDVLPFVVVLFFIGHLASRVATVGLYGGAGSGRHPGMQRATRLALIGLGVLATTLVLAALLGDVGGPLQHAGRLLDPVVEAFAAVLVFVLVQLTRPLLWLIDLLGLDPSAIQRALERISDRTGLGEEGRAVPDEPGVERIFGLLLLAVMVVLVVWFIRRQRDRLERSLGTAVEEGQEETRPVEPAPRPRRRTRIPRRELPENVVRRWYAEVLLELERKGLPRPQHETPAEYLAEVRAAFPEAAGSFRELTRTYEDVRYGSRPVGRDELSKLAPHRDEILDALRRAAPLQAADRAAEDS